MFRDDHWMLVILVNWAYLHREPSLTAALLNLLWQKTDPRWGEGVCGCIFQAAAVCSLWSWRSKHDLWPDNLPPAPLFLTGSLTFTFSVSYCTSTLLHDESNSRLLKELWAVVDFSWIITSSVLEYTYLHNFYCYIHSPLPAQVYSWPWKQLSDEKILQKGPLLFCFPQSFKLHLTVSISRWS